MARFQDRQKAKKAATTKGTKNTKKKTPVENAIIDDYQPERASVGNRAAALVCGSDSFYPSCSSWLILPFRFFKSFRPIQVGGEQHVDIAESLEFKVVSAGIPDEERALLAGLAFEAQVRLDDERHAAPSQAFGKRLPVFPREDGPEMPGGHVVAVNCIRRRGRMIFRLDQMQHQLMTEKVQVDPSAGLAAGRTAKHFLVKHARLDQVGDGKGEMKAGDGHDWLIRWLVCLRVDRFNG